VDVETEAHLRTGVDLANTGRVVNSGAPVDGQDLVNKQYSDYELSHLLSAKGDLLGNTGAGWDGILSVGTEGQFLRCVGSAPLGMSWFTEPEIEIKAATFSGPWAAPQSGIMTYVRCGTWVMIRWPDILAPWDHAAGVGFASTIYKPNSGYYPMSTLLRLPLYTLNNGVYQSRRLELYSDFGIILSSFGGPGPGNCGIVAQTMCYLRG
jgi:hypothetical protein